VKTTGAGPTVFLSAESTKTLTTVYNDLQQLPNAQVYWKRDIPDRWHYRNHERIPEVLIVAEEGWTLMPMGHGPRMSKGAHGYDNELTSMQAYLSRMDRRLNQGIQEKYLKIFISILFWRIYWVWNHIKELMGT